MEAWTFTLFRIFRDRKLSGEKANESGQRHSLPLCLFPMR